jgi:hypothetical protein
MRRAQDPYHQTGFLSLAGSVAGSFLIVGV